MTEDEKKALQQTMGQAFYEDVVRLEAQLAASEQEHQDFRLQNDAEWRAKLDHLKAQIARQEENANLLLEIKDKAIAARDTALGIYFMIDADKAFAHLLAMNEGKKR
jgi:hypothetical protein